MKTYLSLGSNIGDRALNLSNALDLINSKLGLVIDKSSVLETEPWQMSDNTPSFYNQVVCVDTYLKPLDLLDMVENIEKELGRVKQINKTQYESRIIDIDILFYGNLVFENQRLTIPHSLLHKRDFVLKPLNEIATDLEHPILKKTVKEMLNEL